ncbi:MAG TPA: PAS domain S-box protein [Stenomitos sp.]
MITKRTINTWFGLALCLLSGVTIFVYWSLRSQSWLGHGFNPMLIVAIINSFSLMVLAWVYSRLGQGFTPSLYTEDLLCPNVEPQKDGESVAAILDSTLQLWGQPSGDSPSTDRFFNLSLDMLMISNTDGYATQLNPAWERILGFTIEELKAQPWINFVHPQDVEATKAQMEQVSRGVCITRFENRYRRKDGSYKWLSWTAVPFLEEGLIYGVARDVSDYKQTEEALRRVNQELEIAIAERLTQLIQISEDLLAEIAERQQMEEALRSSEQRFRVALQNSPTFVFSQDRELRYTWIYSPNPETQIQRVIGQSDAEIMAPEDAKRLTAIKQRVLTTGVGTREEVFVTVKGEIRYYDLTVEPLFESIGELIGITCAATDITAIRMREQQLRAIFEQSLDAITITDNQGMYLEANPAACQLFGLPLSELLGRRIVDFMEPDFDFKSVWRSFRQQGQLTGKMRLFRLDGTVRNVDYAAKADFLPGQHLSILRDITEREQVEIALRESQRLLQKIADTTPSQLYIYDLIQEGNVYANRRTEELLGCTQAELRAINWQFSEERIHPEDLPQVIESRRRCATAQEGEVVEKEFRLKNSKGEWRWLHTWEVVFSRRPDGQPEKLLGTAIDITKRKQVEEALRISEAQLCTALEASHMGTWSWNILTDQMTWSENFHHVLGLATEGWDQSYKSFMGMIHPEDRDRVVQKVEQILPKRQNYEDEFRIILPNGNVRWLSRLGQVFHDETDRPVRMAGLDLDITDRKHVELALLEERNFISAILEAVNALIAVFDAQGRFVRFNRACEQMTGYSLEEVQGQYIWDLFLIPEEVEQVQSMIQELQSGQFPNESEHSWLTRDGNRHLISWFNTVILDTDGSIKHIISIGIDITDRKRAEDMRRALEREQALSELRLRFFSMASHEFRTPLSTILLTAQILESSAQGWSQDKRTRNLQRIVSAAKEMRQMLDDILTINRAETGRLEFAPTRLELNAFCQQMLQEMRIYATSSHTLAFSSQSEAEWALMDDKLLRYILSNLLSNAVKYSPQGGEIELEIIRSPEGILFKVYDTGIGIPLSDQPHLFEAFHRGANVESIPGSGLGLTVAKKCVELHGGRITFTSEVGVGTTFTVMIPIEIVNQE